ncbi:MAG: hypothetical protein M1582_01365 [Actinobacteria bacterium]|nr:hypothetical protein [Actinomycetota bacterium]
MAEPEVGDPVVDVFVGFGVPFCLVFSVERSQDTSPCSRTRAETMLGLM